MMTNPTFCDVERWLKSLRLHKYSPLFSRLTYEQMLNLTEDYLIDEGVTKGARNKMLSSIKKLKLRQEVLSNMIDDIDNDSISIKEALTQLKDMLVTPMRFNEDLPQLFVRALDLVANKLANCPMADSACRSQTVSLIEDCLKHAVFATIQQHRELLERWRHDRRLAATHNNGTPSVEPDNALYYRQLTSQIQHNQQQQQQQQQLQQHNYHNGRHLNHQARQLHQPIKPQSHKLMSMTNRLNYYHSYNNHNRGNIIASPNNNQNSHHNQHNQHNQYLTSNHSASASAVAYFVAARRNNNNKTLLSSTGSITSTVVGSASNNNMINSNNNNSLKRDCGFNSILKPQPLNAQRSNMNGRYNSNTNPFFNMTDCHGPISPSGDSLSSYFSTGGISSSSSGSVCSSLLSPTTTSPSDSLSNPTSPSHSGGEYSLLAPTITFELECLKSRLCLQQPKAIMS